MRKPCASTSRLVHSAQPLVPSKRSTREAFGPSDNFQINTLSMQFLYFFFEVMLVVDTRIEKKDLSDALSYTHLSVVEHALGLYGDGKEFKQKLREQKHYLLKIKLIFYIK